MVKIKKFGKFIMPFPGVHKTRLAKLQLPRHLQQSESGGTNPDVLPPRGIKYGQLQDPTGPLRVSMVVAVVTMMIWVMWVTLFQCKILGPD